VVHKKEIIKMQIFVRTMKGGKTFQFEVEDNDSVERLKSKIENLSGVPLADQRLKLKGKELQNTSTLQECNVKDKATLFLVYSGDNKVKPVEVESNEPPRMCLGNCGFWGHASTFWYCSQCYAKKTANEANPIKAKNDNVAVVEPIAAITTEAHDSTSELEEKIALVQDSTSMDVDSNLSNAENVNSGSDSENSDTQVDLSRCFECKKKVGIYGTKCKCDHVFCGKHRYSDQHNCKYDYQESGKKRLKEMNPQVKSEKVTKIA